MSKKRWSIASIGPGLITAAVVLGPGSVTCVSKSGSQFGYQLIWVIISAGILMGAYTAMSARIGTITDETLLRLVQKYYGRWLAILMGIASFAVCSCFQAGDNVGVSISMQAIFGHFFPNVPEDTMVRIWSLGFTIIALTIILTANNLYNVIEKIMTVLVLVMMICFVLNLFPARPNIVGVSRGLIPSANFGQIGLITAIVGTTFSVIAAIYQSYIVQNKGWKIEDYKTGIFDALLGIGILAFLSIVIMITAAAVLKPRGIIIKSAGDMAVQLEPLLGTMAKYLFAIGLWGASFSSLVANAIIGGGLLSDSLNLGWKFENKVVKILTIVIMIIGAMVTHISGGKEGAIPLIISAQRLTVTFVPICALVLLLIANNKKLMKEHVNRFWMNALGIIGLLSITWLGLFNLFYLIQSCI